MPIDARYAHTNLIARDWRALAAFYIDVFGCEMLLPERHLGGPDIEAGTGIPGARFAGAHLRLPGHGPQGPTLEIFQYETMPARPPTAVHRPGFGHIAFRVSDVAAARAEVLDRGGHPLGDVVVTPVVGAGTVTWCYLEDPEGNVVELQSWGD